MPLLFYIFIIEGLAFFILRQMFEGNTNLNLVSTVIIAINTIIYLFAIAKYSKNKFEYVILLFAYIIRLVFLYWDIFGRSIFPLPNSGMDSEMYNQNAIMFAEGLTVGRGGFYSIIVGVIYKLFGEQRILAQYFNVMLSIYTIVLIKKALELLNLDQKIRHIILLIVCLLPNFVITSSILLRESIIIFIISLSLLFFIKWWLSNRLYNFIISISLPLLATLFHSGAIAPVLAYLLCYLLYDRNTNKFRFNLKTVTASVGFIIIFFIINSVWGDLLFGKFQGVESTADLTNKVDAYTKGGAAYLNGLQVNSTSDVLLFTPIRMFYFLASPLPWDWRGLGDIIAFVFSALFYLLALYFTFRALKIKNDTNKAVLIALLVMAICSALIFSWGVSNAGTALRHREKFLGVYVILLAISTNSLRRRRKLKGGTR